MKKSFAFLYLSTLLLINACGQQNTIEQGKLFNHIVIKNDTTLSYAIYIPKNIVTQQHIAFIFFDPHGSGDYPVTLYKSLADEFGVILIGNNNSSNTTDFSLISSNFAVLLNEIKSTFKIEEKNIALWGFSGGAKAAMYNAGLNNTISYCVYGGAAMNVQNTNTDLLGFNGRQDMNYTDLLGFAGQQKNNPKHYQIEFTGIHAWPDTTTAKDAFRWLLLKKMQHHEILLNQTFVTKCYGYYKKQTNKLLQSNQLTDAFLNCNKSIYFLQGITTISYFNKQKDSIAIMPLFKKQVQVLQTTIEKESILKEKYQTSFLAKDDTLYWKKEIDNLQTSAKTDKSGIYNRLLGFLSLASYSYANQAFRANDISALEKILFIYQHSDPTNAEQAFMRAKLAVLKHETATAKTALKEAILLGIDKKRIENDVLLKDLQ